MTLIMHRASNTEREEQQRDYTDLTFDFKQSIIIFSCLVLLTRITLLYEKYLAFLSRNLPYLKQ